MATKTGVEDQRKNNVGGITGKGFLPGRSGNPGGRPKGRSLTALLRERLDEIDEATGKSIAQLIVEGWVNAARDGNVPAIKEALDRTEGKVPDKLETKNDTNVSISLHLKAGLDKVYPVSPNGNGNAGHN
jgi:hypothetical protein